MVCCSLVAGTIFTLSKIDLPSEILSLKFNIYNGYIPYHPELALVSLSVTSLQYAYRLLLFAISASTGIIYSNMTLILIYQTTSS